MNQPEVQLLIGKLNDLLDEHNIGYKNDTAIKEMEPYLRRLESECSGNGYLETNLASARHNFEVMFSPRKHLKYGGAEKVNERFRSDLRRVAKWIKSFGNNDIGD